MKRIDRVDGSREVPKTLIACSLPGHAEDDDIEFGLVTGVYYSAQS